jgi:hypothetical protein
LTSYAKWFINVVAGMNIWTFSQYWLSTLDLAHWGGASSKSQDTYQGFRSAAFLSEGAWRIDYRGIEDVYWTPYGRIDNIDHFRRFVAFSVHQAGSTEACTLIRESVAVVSICLVSLVHLARLSRGDISWWHTQHLAAFCRSCGWRGH